MKLLFTGLLGVLLGAGPGLAGGPLIRVQLEYHEVGHELFTELMAGAEADSGPALRGRLVGWGAEGKAKLVETCVLTVMNGQRASLESLREYIYPTEYDPGDGLPLAAGAGTSALLSGRLPAGFWRRPAMMQAFEVRSVGVTLEVEATASANGALVDLRLAPEIVDFLRLDTFVEHVDRWGKAPFTMPVFGPVRTSNGIVVENGTFGLLGVLTPPRPEGGVGMERKLVLLVKADVIPIRIPGAVEDGR